MNRIFIFCLQKIRNFLLHIGRKRYRTNMLVLSTIIYFFAYYSFSSFIPVDAKMIFPSTSFFHSHHNFGLNELRITMKVIHLLKQLNGFFGTWQVSFDIYRSERWICVSFLRVGVWFFRLSPCYFHLDCISRVIKSVKTCS